MILDAWGWCTGTTQRDGTGREEGGGSGSESVLPMFSSKSFIVSGLTFRFLIVWTLWEKVRVE